eukprot:scaffold3.g6162.t1
MDLVSFLENVPRESLEAIYASPYTTAALFRALPPVARQYVLRLLLLDEELAGAVVSSWASPSATSKHTAALSQLSRLALLSTRTGRLGEVSYLLNPLFRGQLRQSVCTRLTPTLDKLPEEVVRDVPSGDEADEHARAQWESLLLFLSGSVDALPGLPRELASGASLDVVQLLLSGGLMVKDEETRAPAISDAGFQFLLMDAYGQLWTLLRQYISDAGRQSGGALGSVISFLLQLGVQGRRPVRLAGLGQLEQRVAAHMAQLGLLMPFAAAGSVWLLPTRLATTMAGGGTGAAADDGFVIVESNYRVYAYTTSPVQIAILRLFVRCDVLLPNLFVGTITRDSATAALKTGITAKQIVAYLRQHAHPRVAGRVPFVPVVVAEQIELWYAEMHRLHVDRCAFYLAFESEELYRRVAAAANAMGAVLCANDTKRQLVVRAQAHDAMRARIKALKEELGV